MDFDGLTPEQKEMALACKTPEELLETAKKVGYQLSDDELNSISGGGWTDCPNYCSQNDTCPRDWYC